MEYIYSASPTLSLSDVRVKPGEAANFTCSVYGYPYAHISFKYRPCQDFGRTADFSDDTCEDPRKVEQIVRSFIQPNHAASQILEIVNFQGFMNTTYTTWIKKQETTIEFVPSSTGQVICEIPYASSSNATAYVLISDLDKDLMIWSSMDNDSQIVVGDEISLTCGASAYKTHDVHWQKDGVAIRKFEGTNES